MTPGLFMVANGFVAVVMVNVGLKFGVSGGFVGIGVAIYYWTSLYFYLDWFKWDSDLRALSDSSLLSLLDEWTSGGPFGRTTPHITRILNSTDLKLKIRGCIRLSSIYQEMIKRETVSSDLSLREKRDLWKARTDEFRQMKAHK